MIALQVIAGVALLVALYFTLGAAVLWAVDWWWDMRHLPK